MSRLTDLISLRERIELEIERERRFLRRVEKLRRSAALAVTTSNGWQGRIITTTAHHFGVTFEEITGPGRGAEVVRARFVACWLMREAGRTSTEVGHAVNRDHTTALNAYKRVEADPALLATAVAIRTRLHGTEGAA